MTDDLYRVLNVDPSATQTQIKETFHALALANHPDRHPDDAVKEARFKEASAAYEILSDPARRAAYDQRRLFAARPAPPPPSPGPPDPPWYSPPPPRSPPDPSWYSPPPPRWKGRPSSRTTFDTRAGRYRGPDGRFRRG